MFWRAEDTRLSLERDGADWPNRPASALIEAHGLRWHVQIMGDGPKLLLLHGTGASTHSWRGLAPLLGRRFRVVAPDLPGHGFTSARGAVTQSPPGMARAVTALLAKIGFAPQVVVGHSAGAAVLARLCLDAVIAPKLLVSLNGALEPFGGAGGHVFPALAKLVFLNPLTPRFFAWTANRATVSRLLEGTGSRIEPEGVDLYWRLLRNPAHVEGALAMMANWDLEPLRREFSKLETRIALVAAANDLTIPPAAARRVKVLLPRAEVLEINGLGHLAHEEAPERLADLVAGLASRATVNLGA
ncbi:MAG: alpha/beta fold hydrolase BchO [Methylocystis sp.]